MQQTIELNSVSIIAGKSSITSCMGVKHKILEQIADVWKWSNSKDKTFLDRSKPTHAVLPLPENKSNRSSFEWK